MLLSNKYSHFQVISNKDRKNLKQLRGLFRTIDVCLGGFTITRLSENKSILIQLNKRLSLESYDSRGDVHFHGNRFYLSVACFSENSMLSKKFWIRIQRRHKKTHIMRCESNEMGLVDFVGNKLFSK